MSPTPALGVPVVALAGLAERTALWGAGQAEAVWYRDTRILALPVSLNVCMTSEVTFSLMFLFLALRVRIRKPVLPASKIQ